MKKFDAAQIEALTQLLAMIGIIGSLIFVGLEMRQSQRIALVSQMQERSYTGIDVIAAFTEADLDWFSTMFHIAPEFELTTQQKAERNADNINWFLYEADYFQYSQGLMTGSVWQAKLHAMEINLKGCAYPEIYEMRAGLVEGEFKSVLDNMPSQCTE